MKKVILIAFYFNQVNEIASKRLRALAKYLPQFGWEPIVIVPDLGFIPKENNDLNCRIIYTEYEDMFTHFSNKFKKSNSVDSNGSINSIESNEDKLKDSTSYSNPIISKAISMAGEVFAYPDGMKYWHESAFKESSKIMDEEEIDAIISSSWPITCHKKRLELKTFENADALTTTTDLAAKTLSTLHPNNRIVPILSGYDNDDFKFLEELIAERDNCSNDSLHGSFDDSPRKLKFIYAGSLYGGKRDPIYLFEAIRQLEDDGKLDSSKISIEFYGDSTGLDEIAKRYGLLDIVHIGGRIAHDEVLKKQLDSDVLLLISWDNEKERMFIPGKIYEYFALKKPVLSIGYKEGSLKDLIDETKVGYHVSSLESTKEALLDIYSEFIEKGTVELNSDINIEDFSMENMAKKFADLLNELKD